MSSQWPFEACYAAFSYGCRLRSDLPEIGALLDRLLAPFRTGDANGVPTFTLTRHAGPQAPYVLQQDGHQILEAKSAGSLLDWVISEITVGAVERAEGFLVVHAGSVGREAVGVIFPAPPDSGKTTLTVGLACSGFSYFSDEASPLELGSGLLHPFCRPAALDPLAIDVIPGLRSRLAARDLAHMDYRVHVTPQDMAGRTGEKCRIGYVVAPTYRRGAPTELIPMSKAEGAMMLAQNSFNLERVGAPGLVAAGKVARDADCYRLFIGDLNDAIKSVERLFAEG